MGFGQVSDCDFYVAYDPEVGDEMGLSTALYLARAAALSGLPSGQTETVDLAMVQPEADVVFRLLREFDSLDSFHSKAEKAITGARSLAEKLRADIAGAMRRLDEVLKA